MDGKADNLAPLVLVAHGSRDPRALHTALEIRARVREARPRLPVRLGHIELNEPLLTDTLAALPEGPAVLVPLLLTRGYHVKSDIPAAARAATHLDARVADPLGPHPLLTEALYDRLLEAGWPPLMTPAERRSSAVVLAAAGSRDAESARDSEESAALLAERLGVPVTAAYACAAQPTVAEAVRAFAARGRHRVAVASAFTAPGRFSAQCAAAAPQVAAAPLGAHPALIELVLRRYDGALAAGRTRQPEFAGA